MQLRRVDRVLRIGHKGAAALAPENTIESLAAAVRAGVDLVEFDVLGLDGRVVLGHSRHELPTALATLDDALEELGPHRVGVHVDVKEAGHEPEIVAALRRHDLTDRALVSSFLASSLRRFAELEPELSRAISYPEDRYGLTRSRLAYPFTLGAAAAIRRVLPHRIPLLLARAGATVASLHFAVLSTATVARCHALGVPVIAWTVDDPALLARLDGIGVDAVVSNDPRIFLATLNQ